MRKDENFFAAKESKGRARSQQFPCPARMGSPRSPIAFRCIRPTILTLPPMPLNIRSSLLCLLLAPALAAQQRTTLTTAEAVRALSLEAAAEKWPVRLEATVGFIDLPTTVFIQDGEAGTFFRPGRRIASLRVGDRVRVEGVTHAGLYLTGIEAAHFEVIGQGPPPAARAAHFDDLASGRWHYQRVQVRGVVRRVAALDENRAVLWLALGRQTIEARVDRALEAGRDWPDALVTVEGLAAGGINERRQLVQPYLRVADWTDVSVQRPAPPLEAVPLLPASRLLRFQPASDEGTHLHRARLRGQLTAVFPDGRLFLRDNSAETPLPFAARLQSPAPELRAGDSVELAGFPEMRGFSAHLGDAQLLASEPGTPPTPRATELQALAADAFDAELVTFTAQVAEQWRGADSTGWRLRAGEASVQAFLPGGFEPALQPGTQVRVTGVCEVESASESGYRARPASARLLLRAPGDVEILRAPPWWTVRRLLGLVAALAALILAALAWIWQLRRQVARQERRLREQVAREAVLDERHRIAREFHDTLEQELAGLSIRLGAVASRPLDDKARSLLDTSQHLLSRVQSEARDLLHRLREDGADTPGLPAALRELAARQPADAPRCEVSIFGDLPALPPAVAHHLRMIAQESLSNALKHACATHIDIRLARAADALELTVRDDGRGFDPNAAPVPGRFGRVGIRERCRKIHAEASWQSAPGQGTEVRVRLPWPPAPDPAP